MGYAITATQDFVSNEQDIPSDLNSRPVESTDPSDMDDRKVILDMKAAGCNIAHHTPHFYVNQEDRSRDKYGYNKLLSFLKGRMKLSIHNGALSIIESTNDHPGATDYIGMLQANQDYAEVLRWMVVADEPSREQVMTDTKESIVGSFKNLKQVLTDSLNDDKWTPFINLLPIHGMQKINGEEGPINKSEKYKQYLKDYVTNFSPQMLSVDCYPVLQYNPVTLGNIGNGFQKMESGELQQVHERFYRTLALVSAKAAETGRPWWYYPLTGEHFVEDKNGFHYPIAREEYIRFQIFSALAYGAKGIVEWRFLEILSDRNNLRCEKIENVNTGYNGEVYLRHPVRANRMRTPVWEYLRRVNAEVRCFQSIFLNAEVKNVYHTNLKQLAELALEQRNSCLEYGTDNLPDISYRLPLSDMKVAKQWGLNAFLEGNDTPLLSVSCLKKNPCRLDAIRDGELEKDSFSNGLGVIVSHLYDKRIATDYVVVVSHDAACYQDVTLTFKEGTSIFQLTPDTGTESSFGIMVNTLTARTVSYLLPPGGYLIFSTKA